MTAAVIVFDAGAIQAYVTLDGVTADEVRTDLAKQVASFKLPRHINVLSELPRTSTGKVLRDAAALRKAAQGPSRRLLGEQMRDQIRDFIIASLREMN